MINYLDSSAPHKSANLRTSSFILSIIGCITVIPIPFLICLLWYGNDKIQGKKSLLRLAKVQTIAINIAIFSSIVFLVSKKYEDVIIPNTYVIPLISFVCVPILFIVLSCALSELLYNIRKFRNEELYDNTARDLLWITPIGLLINSIALIIGVIQDKYVNSKESKSIIPSNEQISSTFNVQSNIDIQNTKHINEGYDTYYDRE